MSFNWMDYLTLADELAGRAKSIATEEARLRSSISRSYYASFILSRNYLRDKESNSAPRGINAHKYVSDQFKFSFDKTRRKLGTNLERLRIDRNKADFDDVIHNLHALSETSLVRAGNIIATLTSIGV